jgi:hypothetical protein
MREWEEGKEWAREEGVKDVREEGKSRRKCEEE